MFKQTKLIAIVLLSGCITSVGETFNNKETEVYEVFSIHQDTLLINSIDATLEMADEVMEQREAEQNSLNRKINQLINTVSEEEELITELERKLAVKDSIIIDKKEELELTLIQLKQAQCQVENTEEILQRYIVSYNVLLEENNLLQTELNETYSHVEYLDSLVFTNKKLTKIYESN